MASDIHLRAERHVDDQLPLDPPGSDTSTLRSAHAVEQAVGRLRATMPVTSFRFEDKTFVRNCGDYIVTARLQHHTRTWQVECNYHNGGWKSGAHCCPADLSPHEALSWAEQICTVHSRRSDGASAAEAHLPSYTEFLRTAPR